MEISNETSASFYILLQKNVFHFIPFPDVVWNERKFQKEEIGY